jgi:RNA polymerase sigma-70 factor (ECF subfamily)
VDAIGDTALVEQARTGHRGAFDLLVARHRGAVFRFARHLTADVQTAEDVLQETFLIALRSLATFANTGSFRGWLLAIARSRIARQRRAPVADDGDESLEDLACEAGHGATENPEALTSRMEQVGFLERAIQRLDQGEREVVVLRDLEGLGGDETALALGLSRAAMKSRLHRGRLRLLSEVRAATQRTKEDRS